MPIPMAVARFNRRVTNPLLGGLSKRAPGLAMIIHQGRRSGKTHETPMMIFPSAGGCVMALTYGSKVDWVRNLVAAGGGEMIHRRKRIRLERPRLISEAEGMALMPAFVRVVLRTIGVTEFLRVEKAPDSI
jgi:deazaflavin-dependent oxidoreductase (nitroreductase family)